MLQKFCFPFGERMDFATPLFLMKCKLDRFPLVLQELSIRLSFAKVPGMSRGGPAVACRGS